MRKKFLFMMSLLLIFSNALVLRAQEIGMINDDTLIVEKTTENSLKKDMIKYSYSDDFDQIKNLIVLAGDINEKDLQVLDEMPHLEKLDLSKTIYKSDFFNYHFGKGNEAKPPIRELFLPKHKKTLKFPEGIFKENKTINHISFNSKVELSSEMFMDSTIQTIETNHSFVVAPAAFANTKRLDNIDLTDAEINQADGAFQGSQIKSIEMPHKAYDLPTNFFADTSKLKQIDLSLAQSLGDYAFQSSNIQNIALAETVSLGTGVFKDTKELKKLALINTNSKLKDDLFYGSGIEELTLPSDIEIGDRFFMNTKNLRSIDLNNFKSFGEKLFFLSHLEEVVLPDHSSLEPYMFAYSEIGRLENSETIDSVKEGAFFGAKIAELKLPKAHKLSYPDYTFALLETEGLIFENAVSFGNHAFSKEINQKLFEDEEYKLIDKEINNESDQTRAGIESLIFIGESAPKVTKNSFAMMADDPPLVLLPSDSKWDTFVKDISSGTNEIENVLRYDTNLYQSQFVSKGHNVQLGFFNPQLFNYSNKPTQISYQWYFQDKKIDQANQASLIIEDFNEDHEGKYQLVITVNNQSYSLTAIYLEPQELQIDSKSFHKGYFVNEKIDPKSLEVYHLIHDEKKPVSSSDIDLKYNFTQPGQQVVRVIYHDDDREVLADFPVTVVNKLPKKIKIKAGDNWEYAAGSPGVEFILTPEQKEHLKITQQADEFTIEGIKKYRGLVDVKIEDRNIQVDVHVEGRFISFIKQALFVIIIISIIVILYLRKKYGMFKVKEVKNEN